MSFINSMRLFFQIFSLNLQISTRNFIQNFLHIPSIFKRRIYTSTNPRYFTFQNRFLNREIYTMAIAQKINNFSSLVKYNFYKVTDVESFKTDFTPNQVVYTLIDGQRLFGRVGINEIFGVYTTPFYFQFKGQSANEMFKRYQFNTYKDAVFFSSFFSPPY